MLILVSNDDGIDAPGLAALADQFSELGEVVVVAPETEQSCKSHSMTLHDPLRVHGRGAGWFGVTGTPADCVYLALHHLFERTPDLVVSGINRGANLGHDVHYSGTVAAAREAAFNGIPSLAVSLDTSQPRRDQERNWDSAARLALHVARMQLANTVPAACFLNLIVPDVPADKLTQLHVTKLGRRNYASKVRVQTDPRGREYYWIGGEPQNFCGTEGSDGFWHSRGHPTLTPLTIEATAHDLVAAIGQWKAP